MRTSDWGYAGFLLLLAVFIWTRDLRWASGAEDTVPILAGIPLFIWLGWPWRMREDRQELPMDWLGAAAMVFALGLLANLTFLLALSWIFCVWAWMKARIAPAQLQGARKLLVLPLLAFPWVTLDCEPVGWAFRLSGAWVTGHFFSAAGFDVVRHGTLLTIAGHPISVEAACSGLNALQSMLIAGSMLAFILLGHQWHYWWNLPVLVAMAWVANTIRIIVLSFAAVSVSPEFSNGPFHEWSGWGVLCVMFLLCWFIFSLQRTATPAVAARTAKAV